MWGHDGGGRDDGYGAASGEVVGSTDLPSSPPIYCPPSLPTTALFLVLPSSTYTDRPGTDPPNSEVAALCSIGQCRRGGPPAWGHPSCAAGLPLSPHTYLTLLCLQRRPLLKCRQNPVHCGGQSGKLVQCSGNRMLCTANTVKPEMRSALNAWVKIVS